MTTTDPCEELRQYLLDYLHHEVDPGLSRQLEIHLERCPSCQDECTAEITITQLLKRCCQDQAPQVLRQELKVRFGIPVDQESLSGARNPS